jgi:predicted deacylase
MMNEPENQELARAFYAPFTLHAQYRPKSLRQSAAKLGKRIIVYEGGESARFNEQAIELGIDGTMRLMKYLGMSTADVPQPAYKNREFMHSSWIRARSSGIFQNLASCGDWVKKNQVVGYITDPFGAYRVKLRAAASGYIISINNNPILHQGDAVMHIGVGP